jgi:hypothetical protein
MRDARGSSAPPCLRGKYASSSPCLCELVLPSIHKLQTQRARRAADRTNRLATGGRGSSQRAGQLIDLGRQTNGQTDRQTDRQTICGVEEHQSARRPGVSGRRTATRNAGVHIVYITRHLVASFAASAVEFELRFGWRMAKQMQQSDLMTGRRLTFCPSDHQG